MTGLITDGAFLSGGGEMGSLVRALDWSLTPLGMPTLWPQSLRTSVSLCLTSHFPSAVCWGPEYTLVYNDAYRPILGANHPGALGRPCFEVWSELAGIVRPLFDAVIATGEPTHETIPLTSVDGRRMFGVSSGGVFYVMAPADDLKGLR